MGSVLTYTTEFIGSIGQKWLVLPISWQRRLQKLVFPEGIPYFRNQGFGTAKLGYIFELIRTFGGQKSFSVDQRGINWNQLMQESGKWSNIIHELETENQYMDAA